MDKKILIVDGNNAAWRLMKRLPLLTVKGQPIQVVYGFLRLLRGVVTQFSPDSVIVFWDFGISKFRKEIFKDYKGNRDHYNPKKKMTREMTEHELERKSLLSQIAVLNEILPRINVGYCSWPNTEADDLIGLACMKLEGLKIIVSSDYDMLQLVNEQVQVWNPKVSSLYTVKNFLHKTGLTPYQHLEMKALIGDPSDNIPGVAKGFGPATATELLKRYGSIENLFTPKVEKDVFEKGNRFKLLYSEGSKERVYRNLILMDLSLCGSHVYKKEKAVKKMQDCIRFYEKIDEADLKRVFIEKAFSSLLEQFSIWVKPFENLDWSRDE